MGKNGTSFELKRLADVFASMIPTIFTGLSVCVMFSANQFNLGSEGGCMLGAFAAGMVAVYLPMAAGVHAAVAVLIAGIVVAAVMLIPALLKAKMGVSEMVNSLMLNYIIMYIIKYLMSTTWRTSPRARYSPSPLWRRPRSAPLWTTVFSPGPSSPGAL